MVNWWWCIFGGLVIGDCSWFRACLDCRKKFMFLRFFSVKLNWFLWNSYEIPIKFMRSKQARVIINHADQIVYLTLQGKNTRTTSQTVTLVWVGRFLCIVCITRRSKLDMWAKTPSALSCSKSCCYQIKCSSSGKAVSAAFSKEKASLEIFYCCISIV